MRTPLIIPDELLEKVRLLSGESSKTKAVIWALESCVKAKGQEGLLSLRGKLQLDYDRQHREEEELEAQNKGKMSLGNPLPFPCRRADAHTAAALPAPTVL